MGVPRGLVIAVHKHVGKARGIDVGLVVSDVHANVEGCIGSSILIVTGFTLVETLRTKGIEDCNSSWTEAEDDRLAPELDMAVKRKNKEKTT